MKTMCKISDFSQAAKLLKIGLELEKIESQSIFAHAIKEGLNKPGNIKPVLRMIQDQAVDNRELIAHIVGENTLREIEGLTI